MPKEFTGWDNNSTNARPGFSRAVGRSLVPGRSGSGEYPRATPDFFRAPIGNCEILGIIGAESSHARHRPRDTPS